jgi:hypothetical protein
VTDLDVLAVRFRDAGYEVVPGGGGHRQLGAHAVRPDPVLGCPPGEPDMIVGEIKEGAAQFNAATLDPVVLQLALARLSCCSVEHASKRGPGTAQSW